MSDEENSFDLIDVFVQICSDKKNHYGAYTQLEKHSRCFGKHIVKVTEIIGQQNEHEDVRKQAALEFLRQCSSDIGSLKNYFRLKYSEIEETDREQLVENLKWAIENVDEESLVWVVRKCWGAMIELDENWREIDIRQLSEEPSNPHQKAAK